VPRQCLTVLDAVPAKGQHTSPCSDCPWGRTALPGWLGSMTIDEWLAAARGEARMDCHVASGAQCAGAAIYRRNTGKLPRDPAVLRLEADRALVFATPMEFQAHHARPPAEWVRGRDRTRQGETEMPKAENAKANLVASSLKAKHADAVTKLKDKHEKALAAAVGKEVKAREKVLADVVKIAGAVAEAGKLLDGLQGNLPPGVKKALGAINKAEKLLDKHV